MCIQHNCYLMGKKVSILSNKLFTSVQFDCCCWWYLYCSSCRTQNIPCNISETYFIIRNMRHSISYTFINNYITCVLGKPSFSCSLTSLNVMCVSTWVSAQVHCKQCCKIQWQIDNYWRRLGVKWNHCNTNDDDRVSFISNIIEVSVHAITHSDLE